MSYKEWPRAFDTATLTVSATESFEAIDGSPGYEVAYSFEHVWTRAAYLDHRDSCGNYALPARTSLATSGEFLSVIDCCYPRHPLFDGLEKVYGEADTEIVGTYQATYFEDTPDPTVDVLMGSSAVSIEPVWDSESRVSSVIINTIWNEDEPPVDITPEADVDVTDVTGTGVITNREQDLVATYVDSEVAMSGTADLLWIQDGVSYYFTATWTKELSNRDFSPHVVSVEQVAPFPTYDAWDDAETYAVYDLIEYDSVNYEALLAHTAEEFETPDTRPDLWRVFDIFNHIEITARHNGLRFAFLGMFADQAINNLTIEDSLVRAYPITRKHNRVTAVFTAFADGEATEFGATLAQDTTSSAPGDGDFATDLSETIIADRLTRTYTASFVFT